MDSSSIIIFSSDNPWMIAANVIWLVLVFLLGAAIGSFLNVCIVRLPMEKSILWPKSHCFNCFQPISWKDNLPILGYLRLRGRCRTCGEKFSSRYMWVEIGMGIGFALLFWLEILQNWHGLPYFKEKAFDINAGLIPMKAWLFFFHHAAFLSFLTVAAVTDLNGRIIPLSVTIPGTIVGIISGTFLGWPWPTNPANLQQELAFLANKDWFDPATKGKIPSGLYPWPVWGPLPNWLPPGSIQLGLATTIVGVLVGTLMSRMIKFVFEKGLGREALGLGDADLMMMGGAFMGWQMVVIGFFVGCFVTLLLALPPLIAYGKRYAPFGPGLALGFLITLFIWEWFSPEIQDPFFSALLMGFIVLVFVVGGLVGGYVLSFLPAPPDSATKMK